jgi:serine/threonine protein phosphatase PrpC
MSTHKFSPKMEKGVGLFALSALGGVLIALQLLLPSIAFAFSSSTYPAANPDPPKSLARAGVSVVRLVLTYNLTTASAGLTPTIQNATPGSVGGQTLAASGRCTILGVLIRSWTAVAGETTNNNWVLTDGAMLNFNPSTCGPGATMTLPASIKVFASSAYTATNSNPQLLSLGSLNNPVVTDFRCVNPSACSTGVMLFPFTTDAAHTLPYIDLPIAPRDQAQRIGLMNGSATAPLKIADEQQIRPFLVPTTIPASGSNEAGTPLVDDNGDLVGMHLLSTATPANLADISNFVDQQDEFKFNSKHTNLLHDNWKTGIDKYYKTPPDYPGAQQAFQAAEKLNPDFKAGSPSIFQHLAPPSAPTGTNPNATPTAQATNSGTFLNSGIPTWLLSIGGLVILIVLLILISQTIARRGAQRRKERAGFKADRQVADRRAAEDLQRQQQMPPLPASQAAPSQAPQATQIPTTRRQKTPAAQQAPQPVPAASTAPLPNQPPIRELPCPNCGNPVQVTANFCPYCRSTLSPSASGAHVRATPPSSAAASEPTVVRNSTPPVSPPAQQVPLPAQYAPPPPVPPQPSIAEQPTMVMPPQNGHPESEKTQVYSVQQMQGRNLSLAVGTRSDPGIKRKHKPNEDSLFAMKGERTLDSQPEQFGLFVVADGMGGHANGQDASRLAIQTIVDAVLPPLSEADRLNGDALQNLLLEGVQRANQAVYQHNQEVRADMGTTMTAALVVGSTAYVANVGDSRTYLYREPDGLKKVTNDHSVVASLVEAGIIKPDDIYTHPKRNQIYRSLGEKPTVEVDGFKVPLQMGDKLLLCSDGLWDMVRDPTIEKILKTPIPDPGQTGNALIKAALDGGGEDNVSVIVIQITEPSTHTGMTGFNVDLVAKPETVTLPKMPK